ncbi:unnamed protein product [Closterium sp. NIES-53]
MATITILAFDAEGHPIEFEDWLEDLHLYLQSVTRDDVSLFEHTPGSLTAPAPLAEPAVDAVEEVQQQYWVERLDCTRWTPRDATARLAVRANLPLDQRANFRQCPLCSCLPWPFQPLLIRGVLPSLLASSVPFAPPVDFLGAEELSAAFAPSWSGVEAASLGAGELASIGTGPAESLHTFTLDSDASRCFFRDNTVVILLTAPIPVTLADPSSGQVVDHSSTILPYPATLSGSLTGLHPPSFARNLVSTGYLQDQLVTTTIYGDERMAICTDTESGSCVLFVLVTHTPVPPLAPPSWSPLPAVPPQHALASPYFRPPEVPAPAPVIACAAVHSLVEGLQRAAPHSSFPLTTAPLQTLHMDV